MDREIQVIPPLTLIVGFTLNILQKSLVLKTL